jgi:predicted  nucleic acid-binding Zn-ribbon protein
MQPVKHLLLWHRAKEAKQRAETELSGLEREKEEWQEKLERLTRTLSTEPAPSTPDEEIARLLREQELWLMRKDWERFLASYQEREAALSDEIHRQQFEIWKWEQELDEALLKEYHRIGERVSNPVVEVRNQSCMGCFLPLSVSKLSEWRRAKGLVTCDECGRILV